MIYAQLALAGIATGSIAALSGLGLVLTYRATGVFNFAHGAIAMFVAYLLWQMRIGWHWPLILAAPIAILVCGPGIGLILERLVFRPLETKGASTSEKLVATLGVFVVLVGLALTIWGPVHKSDSPDLFGSRPFRFTSDLQMGQNQFAEVLIVLLSGAVLLWLFRYTHTGTRIRAVVDRRQLADLSAVNANRVSALGWALGCGFAGLTGVLLAPQLELDPFRLTLLVVDTFGVAVIARLTSMPLAVAGGIVLGVVQSLLTRWTPSEPWASLKPNLLVVALIAFLLIYRSLNQREGDGGMQQGPTAAMGRSAARLGTRAAGFAPLLALAAGVPLVLSSDQMPNAEQVLAFAVIFLSITAVTGFTGQVTLGQAGFAGLGALLTSRLSAGDLPLLPKLPVLASMFVASALVALLGAVTGYSALRRRGLFLGLTTLAVGLVCYRFIFENPFFSNQVMVNRPSIFGVSLDGERAYYWFSLACLAVTLGVVDLLRRGELGRVLAAMRDSEVGSQSIGLDLRRYKLFVFSVCAFIAAFGGSLLAQQQRAFVPLHFDPFQSLFWFTAVIVAGSSYVSGAVIGAILFVVLDAVLGAGTSTLVIGLLALSMSRLRGGLVGTALELLRKPMSSPGASHAYAEAVPGGAPREEDRDEPDGVPAHSEPSQFARRLLRTSP